MPPPIDPRTGLRSNIYCGGASLMGDGRVLVTGGYLDFDETPGHVNDKGLNHTWTFDPGRRCGSATRTSAAERHVDITGGRW